jgi:Zn-dependent protease
LHTKEYGGTTSLPSLQQILIGLPILFFSLTVHEFSHAWMANRLGDPTAKYMGRLSLNPLAHLDLMGVIMMVASGFRFGWAKPVPINPANFRDWRRGTFLVSIAGPVSNLMLAAATAIVFHAVAYASLENADATVVYRFLYSMIFINCALAFFNMITLPPLDGSKVLISILPPHMEALAESLERYGPMILLAVIAVGFMLPISPIWIVIGPFVELAVSVFTGIS